MPRRQKPVRLDVIHHLDDMIELRVLEVIQDGKRKRSNVYLIECRRKQIKQSTISSTQESKVCVLKTFPPNEFHERLFEREVAAYTELQRPTAAVDPESAWAVLPSYNAQRSSWPFCFGRLQLPDTMEPFESGGGWIRPRLYDSPASGKKHRRALLLEFMPGCTPLTLDRLNVELAAEIRRIISELHARNVVHGDFVDHASWPTIGFGNIFLRKGIDSGADEAFVMDFNRSRIIGTHPRDQAMALEESEKMADLLGRALANKMAVDEIPKEVRKLLG